MSTLSSSSHTVRKPPWYLSASLLLTGYRYELKHICGRKLARNARNNMKYVRFVVHVCVLVENVDCWCPLVFVDRRFCQTKLSWLLYRNRTEAERMENIWKSHFLVSTSLSHMMPSGSFSWWTPDCSHWFEMFRMVILFKL